MCCLLTACSLGLLGLPVVWLQHVHFTGLLSACISFAASVLSSLLGLLLSPLVGYGLRSSIGSSATTDCCLWVLAGCAWTFHKVFRWPTAPVTVMAAVICAAAWRGSSCLQLHQHRRSTDITIALHCLLLLQLPQCVHCRLLPRLPLWLWLLLLLLLHSLLPQAPAACRV